ncbi:DNA polymerase IV [Nocardioides nematodiphilus]|uniref:DNA polymerase IV n=1 Tax=Nocardioides nematodiphilus TaxID=2849669 RepID=UPI001CD9F787|nr:DNA polymerase IV [Nocardioides nematodiphilus]MCA1984055.1 DNA polymerase IV [Nocardioides nematodiphilus]
MILHADLDSFYASVEQRDDASLRGRPVAVGGGIVLAASYEAKAYGVRTPVAGSEARRLCPGLITVPPRFEAYVEASRRVFEIFRDTTPLVEGVSIDEAFLDVGGLRRLVGEPVAIAEILRRRVRAEVGLPISVGVARTKYLAKVASAVSKPDGLLLVEPEREEEFLHPLPVERLWGVGAVTAGKLRADGIRTVGDLARREQEVLSGLVGKASGHHLWALANLRDPRPVVVGKRRGSVGAQRALGRRPTTPADLDAHLVALIDRVARRLRAGERIGRTVTLRLRFDDYTRATRSATLGTLADGASQATGATDVWVATARTLLRAALPLIEQKGCTLIGVSISGLAEAGTEQLELPLEWTGVEGRIRRTSILDGALDAVKDKYGTGAVTRAVLVGRDSGFEAPLLPEA